MSVSRAVVRTPILAPVATIDWASIRAESRVFIKAPEPNFTSSTGAERLSASFLLMMLAVIRGIEATVAVTPRRA